MRASELMSNISDCPESLASWFCLNGATCFSVKIQESVLYNCWCAKGYHGARCDYKYLINRQQAQSEGQFELNTTPATSNRLLFDGSIRNDNYNQQELSGLRFVVASERHDDDFFRSSHISWFKRQQESRHGPASATYLILYASLLLSIIILICFMIKFLYKNDEPRIIPSDYPASDQRVKTSSLEGRPVVGGVSQSGVAELMNQYELAMIGPELGSEKIDFDQARQQRVLTTNYTRERSFWTNYGHANCYQ